jgi:hypothetical protein
MKNIYCLFIIIFTFFLSSIVFGTEQRPDIIIYNGKNYVLGTYPLERYFEKYPDKCPKREIKSTALWRGYIATFEIKDNQLYLKDIEIQVIDTTVEEKWKTKWESVKNEVFSKQELVKMDWFTGLLDLPDGEPLKDMRHIYFTTYERYILLEFNNGILKKEIELEYKEYEEFKEKQFQAFKKTGEYKKIREKIIAENKKYNKTYSDMPINYTDESIDYMIQSNIIEYSSKILVEDDE